MKIYRSIKKKIRFTGGGTDVALRILDRFGSRTSLDASLLKDRHVKAAIDLDVIELSDQLTCTSGLIINITSAGEVIIAKYNQEVDRRTIAKLKKVRKKALKKPPVK